jgi:DNA-binding LacI/PurR family transcriptional regulator/signal transduction histidine kinase/ActR/RegA family two-component response regulator
MVVFDDGYEAELRRSIDNQCRELDLNLLLVYGRAFEEPQSAAHNAIFDLVHPERVDALIVIAGGLAAHCGKAGMTRFVERYARLPLCSVGVALPGVPSVVLDIRLGLAAVIEHLLGEHGCRRVAFIGGPPDNPEASVRLEVYQEVLAAHGIPHHPALVESSNFTKAGGRAAMDEILGRGVALDAVAAANDTMALGAIDALRERGYHVPDDLPVTGFDDLMLARLCNPALTTVAQPFSIMAQAALHVVLEQLAGRAVPDRIELPCELVVRRSCGCNSLTYADGPGAIAGPALSPSGRLRERSAELRIALAACLRRADENGSREADQLLGALQHALYGHPESFHHALEGMLELAGADNERYRTLHNAIMLLRREFHTVTTAELEALWCDAVGLIAVANTTAQVEHRLRMDEDYVRLLTTGERVSLALDLPALRKELLKSLPLAGFGTAFLACHPAGDTTVLEPFVCLLDGQPRDPPAARFPAWHLLPDEAYPPERRHSSVVFPLAFEAQRLGVAVFEYSPRLTGYALVRDQISAALRSVLLHQEVVAKTMLHERSVQERLAAAQRLQSLSVLAGGVAHDLNNALGPLVALPEVILDELAEFEALKGTVPQVAEDIASMKAAALRASQTIKELLTMGRQGRTPRRPLDLRRTIEACLSGDSLRCFSDLNPNVRVVLELSTESLVVRASEVQLSRAITNLVRNAIEATPGSGKVVVRVSSARLAEPNAGYETVEPGDYAVVTVSDSGTGIPAAQLGRVFEPFFSSKRAGEHSGTGLGLAIVLGVVKEHKGFVDVASTIDEGTQITLYLPRVYQAPLLSEPVTMTPNGHAKILIVDDDPAQLRTGRRVLTRLGYEVHTLDTGRSAYQLFERAAPTGKSPYDLVILDMLLNDDWDGLQVFEQIQQLFPAQRAIVASGHAPSERAEKAVARGLAWLAKPYTTKTLAVVVKAALEAKGLEALQRTNG